jgi:hypothetical protein
MSTKRRLDNLEMVLGQLSLKIFGTEVYLDRPIASRLREVEVESRQNQRRLDVHGEILDEIVENTEKKT